MIRRAQESGWRAMALAAALFAITLNCLQPVAHAALMRDGAPTALWTVFCHAAATDSGDKPGSSPAQALQDHQCCLGLAHTAALVEPAANDFVVVRANLAAVPLLAAEQAGSVGIRDGPHRPRGPPSFD